MGYHASARLAGIAGMQEFSQTLCSCISSWHEHVLFILMLGVAPAPGVGTKAQRSICSGPLAFGQLIVFINLLCSFWLPLFAAHIVELHAKLSYWQARGIDVVAAPSLLLLLPKHRVLSHVLAGLLVPAMLRGVAEWLAPFAAATIDG
jgi:hypothetical protein